MITPELKNYLRQKLAQGATRQEISTTLLGSGWTSDDIAEGFSSLATGATVLTPTVPVQTVVRRVSPVPSRFGKKATISGALIVASIVYAVYQNILLSAQPTTSNVVGTTVPVQTAVSVPVTSPASVATSIPVAKTQPVTTPTPVQTPAPTPTPVVTKPKGQYVDGTYTGSPADAYYGTIQVQAVIQNGALADVIFLQHPSDRGTSVRINNYAMPILKQEAISAQSANVNIVSGASDSSGAFQQSLASALSQAKS